MGRRAEVSYNPQLGYLKTIFTHDFDFLVGVRSYQVLDDGVEFEVDTYRKSVAKVLINFVSDTAARVRMYPISEHQYFNNEIFEFKSIQNFKVEENEEFIVLKTSRAEIKVRKGPWEVSIYLDEKLKTKEQIGDSNVDNMCKYLPIGFEYNKDKKVCKVHESMYMYSDEAFYGFGEKFTEFNKRGQKIHCWQCDALSTNTEKSYKNHPFFISSRGYAILLNSFTKCTFDMGNTSNISYGFEVEDQFIDYIMFLGDNYKDILKDYIEMTGKIPIIPKWAFGLWMSKCVYKNQEEVYNVVETAKAKGVQIDVINLDAWQDRNYNGAWVWDKDRFQDPQGMIDYLKENRIHLCLWIYPYISELSEIFTYAKEQGFLVKDQDGEPIKFFSAATQTTKVGCFDFTNPSFIKWYVPRVEKVLSMGIGAVKTDFSEAVPEDAVYYDGSNGIQGHNKLTFIYAKTIYSIMKSVKEKIGERPMLWGRSGYAGSHTIPAAWAGDSSTHLNNHACILKGGLSISISGIPFWGFDMGGFYNTDHDGYECMPSYEEYIRSIQFGFLSPLSRCHGKTPREPWNYSKEVQKIFSHYNDLRHRLAPYLYSMAYKSHYDSIPMLRPLIMEFPQDLNVKNIELQYMLGDNLLVAPVFDQDSYCLYLPKGEWTNMITREKIMGPAWITPKVTLQDIPYYIKENSIIPMLSESDSYNLEENYMNLEIHMSINDVVKEVYYDDNFRGNFDGLLSNGDLTIITNLDVNKIIVYTKKQLSSVKINGCRKAYEEIDNNTFQIVM